jgi:hypothetical protein
MAGPCDDNNETMGSLKGGEFLDKLSVCYQISRRALLYGISLVT